MRRAPSRSPRWTTSFPPWRPDFLEVFRLASEDWRPPAYLIVRANPARTRMHWEANFHRPDGQRMRLSVAMSKAADGQWFADKEGLDMRLTWKPEVVR